MNQQTNLNLMMMSRAQEQKKHQQRCQLYEITGTYAPKIFGFFNDFYDFWGIFWIFRDFWDFFRIFGIFSDFWDFFGFLGFFGDFWDFFGFLGFFWGVYEDFWE
jgi:hypothetical protein